MLVEVVIDEFVNSHLVFGELGHATRLAANLNTVKYFQQLSSLTRSRAASGGSYTEHPFWFAHALTASS